MVVHKEADQDFDFAWRHCKLHLLDLWRFIFCSSFCRGKGRCKIARPWKRKIIKF